ncbi:hypothetical protein C4K26_1844 [Pseudomonas chlororaphis]|nr:hypothetical protein C4K26_1844 [Pseudomonas chlororaphis]
MGPSGADKSAARFATDRSLRQRLQVSGNSDMDNYPSRRLGISP